MFLFFSQFPILHSSLKFLSTFFISYMLSLSPLDFVFVILIPIVSSKQSKHRVFQKPSAYFSKNKCLTVSHMQSELPRINFPLSFLSIKSLLMLYVGLKLKLQSWLIISPFLRNFGGISVAARPSLFFCWLLVQFSSFYLVPTTHLNVLTEKGSSPKVIGATHSSFVCCSICCFSFFGQYCWKVFLWLKSFFAVNGEQQYVFLPKIQIKLPFKNPIPNLWTE